MRLLLLVFISLLLVPVAYAEHPWQMIQGNQMHTGLSPYDTSHVNGAIKWTFETGDGIESSPTIAEDGTIFFGSHDGYLYALNPDGTLKWKYKPAEPIYDERWKHYAAILSSPAIAEDGTVYVIAPDDFLHAVKEGKEKWRFPLKWDAINFWSSPGIGPDGTIYAGSARINEGDNLVAGFYAINPDGKEKWHYEIDAGVPSSPAIADDGTVYINGNVMKKGNDATTTEGYLFAFDSNGKLKWKFKTQDWVESSPSIAEDGTIYTGSKEGRVYALNPDGTKKWEFATGDGVSGIPAIGKDGTLYIGSWDNNFYALTSEGKEKWRFPVDEGFESIGSSAVIGSEGTIYFGSSRGLLYALHPNGTQKWRMSDMGSVASAPAIGKDGTVYVGAWNKKFYAIGAGEKKEDSEARLECHETQLKREVKFSKEPINTCIEGTCDSYETKCQRKAVNGSCYAPIELCVSKNCRKYRSYCNILIKNLEPDKGFTAVFKENYITADGQKLFLKEMKAFLTVGQERSIVWQYEMDADELGYCDYSDLANPICDKKEEKASWNFTEVKEVKPDDRRDSRNDLGLPGSGPPKECFIGGKLIGEAECRAKMENRFGTEKTEQQQETPVKKSFFQRVIDWFGSLFKHP